MKKSLLLSYITLLCLFLNQSPGWSQSNLDTLFSETHNFRFAGPFRGGRCTAVAGVAGQPHTFLMGSTGGGVWRTTDAGQTWSNVSDRQIKCGSIGSIAVAPSASYTIYVGTGSDSPRGNISAGIGIYKSEDGGNTWLHKGLDSCGQIGEIVIHPANPEVVYVAALGNIFKPNKERGVYRSLDGGSSWEQILYLSDTVGAIDLKMDPQNPKVLYAGMWRAERKPWTMIDGGYQGGLYKTVDGGETWDKIVNGLPAGLIGRIGIAISPVNPSRIWVIQQAADEKTGGVYRSDDDGKTWTRICRDHKLRQRGWYYSRIFADTKDENTVYVTNTGFYKSIDGGKNFDYSYKVPHGDCHDVWINPENPDIIINSNDGGATITLNGGKTWSTQNNQPTPEFYRLSLDNQWPYRMYAGQQDNTTISIPSRSSGGLDPKQVWYEVGGGESADIAVHPENPNLVYATTYSGIITRVNLETDEVRDVGAYPHYTEGTEQRDLKYRWQWNFPIRISKHNPDIIYHTSNFVHKSIDEGQTWTIISPDLTRDLDVYHDIPGGPIQHDGTGVEVYSTIFAFEESPFDSLTLWAGSDDGLIHITRDGGKTWVDITPPDLPSEATINQIFLSPHKDGRAYVAIYNYRYGDFRPYLYKTEDFGSVWELKITNIDQNHFVRSVVEDPQREGSLFAGTEYGLYHSFDAGNSWHSWQLNLPHTPITDLKIHQDNLVMSTQGRGFWILDDLSVLHQWSPEISKKEVHLFTPNKTYRSNLSGFSGPGAPAKASYQGDIHFYLNNLDTSTNVSLKITDETGKVVVEASNAAEAKTNLPAKKGLNLFRWNLRYPAPTLVKDLVMMDMRYPGQGPKAPAGKYAVNLTVGKVIVNTEIQILPDPRWEVTNEDLLENYRLANEIGALISKSQEQIKNLRGIRKQLDVWLAHLDNDADTSKIEKVKAVITQSENLENSIFQNQIETSQDEINYRRLLTNHLIRLYRVVIDQNDKPSQGELERWEDLKKDYAQFEAKYEDFIAQDMPTISVLSR
jgi:photosystem II stability/assembly factor-like uncharacterized protein